MPISKKITLPGGVCLFCVKFSSCLYSDQLTRGRTGSSTFCMLTIYLPIHIIEPTADTHITFFCCILYSFFLCLSYKHNLLSRDDTSEMEIYFRANKFSGFQKRIYFIFSEREREGDGKCLTWLDRKRNPLICLGSQLLQGFQKPKTNMMNK